MVRCRFLMVWVGVLRSILSGLLVPSVRLVSWIEVMGWE